jgi:hypothetical protein
MRVLTKQPGLSPNVEEVASGLESMQKMVGGYIERIVLEAYWPAFEGSSIDLYAHEESKMQEGWRERINFPLPHPDTGETFDVAVGDVFFCASDDEGESISLTDEQIALILETMGWSTD